MQSKLQELTEKIYQEGLEKGNEEAKAIIDSAKQESRKILEDANKEAEDIIANAKKVAEETKKNTESEIKLSSKQAVNALKQQITEVINNEVVGSASKGMFDSAYIKQIVETTLSNWSKEQSTDFSVLLPKEKEAELTGNFSKSVKSLLDKGVEIKFDDSVRSGFQISPKDGSYKVSFTEEDFNNFFKQYLRPKLIELLFED